MAAPVFQPPASCARVTRSPYRRAALATVAILIPAWQPDHRLRELVAAMLSRGFRHLVLVDDGSRAETAPLFAELGALDGVSLCRHTGNQGKGRALKTGFQFVLRSLPGACGVVTADADGQHAPEDIAAVADQLASNPTFAVLGVRSFTGAVPWASRLGNALTHGAFHLLCGHNIRDTQTGLRGLPTALLPELLEVPGERYEYEMAMLAHLCDAGPLPVEVPIRTIYLEANRGSHFHPLRDSVRVYRSLLRASLQRVLRGARVSAGRNAPRLRRA